MIISIEQRQSKLIVSHINKEGNLAYMQLNIPVSHQYSYVYSKSAAGSLPGIKSWEDRKSVV